MSSLLESITYQEYKTAMLFTREVCEELARLANIRSSYGHLQKPGEQLIKDLHRWGLTAGQYRNLLRTFNSRAATQPLSDCFRPQSKVAIMIANELYRYMPKLRTPEKDCKDLGKRLKKLGFIVVILKDLTADVIKIALSCIMEVIPEGSYCAVYYGGHGFELCGTRYALGIDSPCEDVRSEHVVSATCILRQAATRQPELCALLMDTCAFSLCRESNPALFERVPEVERYSVTGSVVIGYSSSSEESAYEAIEMSFTNSESVGDAVQLNTERHARAVPAASLYAAALCRHIRRDLHIGDILDLVADDLSRNGQTPVKVQSGPTKRYLHDKVSGDHGKVLTDIIESLRSKNFNDYTIL